MAVMSASASVRSLVVSADLFDGVKVFSATMAAARQGLGEQITQWIEKHPHYHVTEFVVAQSSDAEFHCLSITVFYRSTPT